MTNEKVYAMHFAKIYPLLVNKVVRKGRTQEEVDDVIAWMTGYNSQQITSIVKSEITYQEFFENAPAMNPERFQITGSICGVKIDEIKEPLMKEIRYLDKLVDNLAKGKNWRPPNHG